MPSRRVLSLLGVSIALGVAVALGVGRGPSVGNEERPNFLVIDIDTLRADRIGATRDGQPVAPTLDKLARRGARFTEAYSQSGWTMPALVSALTGTLPVALAAADGQVSWRAAGARDLAEIFGIYGYTTFAFWGATIPGIMGGAVTPSFHHSAQDEGRRAPPGESVIAWLAQSPPEPFFAYVHDIDLHHAEAWESLSTPIPFDHPSMAQYEPDYQRAYARVKRQHGEAVAQTAVTSRYDGVLNLYDSAVGRMLDTLKQTGQGKRTVIIVTSDHGEDFFEHSVMEHGLLHDTTLHVPLIIYDPGATSITVDTMVQTVDLAPTLLARAGLPPAASMDGFSLLPLLGGKGEPYVERPVFSLSEACHVSLRTRDHKLILRDSRPRSDRTWRPAGGANAVLVPLSLFAARNPLGDAPLADCSAMVNRAEGRRPAGRGPSSLELAVELYDLKADPGEYTNVVDTFPKVAVELLEPLLHTLSSRATSRVGGPRETLSPLQVKTLKENGYWGLVQPGAEGR